METLSNQSGKSKRGFASLSPERRREIAQKGGQRAHVVGKAHKFTAGSEEAKKAGRKGGSMIARNRDHMAEIGRRGGLRGKGGRIANREL